MGACVHTAIVFSIYTYTNEYIQYFIRALKTIEWFAVWNWCNTGNQMEILLCEYDLWIAWWAFVTQIHTPTVASERSSKQVDEGKRQKTKSETATTRKRSGKDNSLPISSGVKCGNVDYSRLMYLMSTIMFSVCMRDRRSMVSANASVIDRWTQQSVWFGNWMALHFEWYVLIIPAKVKQEHRNCLCYTTTHRETHTHRLYNIRNLFQFLTAAIVANSSKTTIAHRNAHSQRLLVRFWLG